MKLNAGKLSLATAGAFAILWVICSALILTIPDVMLTASGYMAHAEFTSAWSLTGVGFLVGLVLWSLIRGVTVWLVAVLFNLSTS